MNVTHQCIYYVAQKIIHLSAKKTTIAFFEKAEILKEACCSWENLKFTL